MHATNPHQIESESVASELITRHLRATSAERQLSNGAIAMIAALILLPLVLLLVSGAGA
jgi:hypothetical protein